MPNAACSDAAVQPYGGNDDYRAIVSDLVCLIEHVQSSMKLVELAIAGAAPPSDQELAANIIVLDDVTPRYLKANATLNSCNASLGIALHFLLDATTSKHGPDGFAGPGLLRSA
jgi:hypothetical protein